MLFPTSGLGACGGGCGGGSSGGGDTFKVGRLALWIGWFRVDLLSLQKVFCQQKLRSLTVAVVSAVFVVPYS